jgi:hypothetical protein
VAKGAPEALARLLTLDRVRSEAAPPSP